MSLTIPHHRPVSVRSSTPVLVGVVLLGGLALGIGTQVLQGLLPSGLAVLANSGVMWALGAAVIGAVMRSDRAAASTGAAALVIASYSYYQAVEWFEHSSSDAQSARLWAVVGLVVGPVFGVVGRRMRVDATHRALCIAVVAGALIGEGIHLVRWVGVDELREAGLFEAGAGVFLMGAAATRYRRPVAVVSLSLAAAAVTAVSILIIGGGGLL